jgi:hypothetical protein
MILVRMETRGHSGEKSMEWTHRPEMMKKVKEEREKNKKSGSE